MNNHPPALGDLKLSARATIIRSSREFGGGIKPGERRSELDLLIRLFISLMTSVQFPAGGINSLFRGVGNSF